MDHLQETQNIQRLMRILIEVCRRRWAERGSVHNVVCDPQNGIYVIEFKLADVAIDELFNAFEMAYAARMREARSFIERGCHFGVAYLANPPGQHSGLIRAIVAMAPDDDVDTELLAATGLPKRETKLSVQRYDIDPLDPDAHWRWLAEGISASMYKFDAHRPRICVLGEQTVVSVAPSEITALDFELIVTRWLQPQNTRRSAAIGIECSSIPIR